MQFGLDEDAIALRDAIERQVGDCAAQGGDGTMPGRRVWNSLVDTGWPALALPNDRGGIDADLSIQAFLMESCGYHGLVTPFLSSVLLGARILAQFASTPMRDALIAAVVAGQDTLHLAHFDFDPRKVAQAQPVADGWHINGRKKGVLGAAETSALLVSARTPDGAGLFLVPAGTAGVSIRSTPSLRGEPIAAVTLDCRLPGDCLLATGDAAEAVLDQALDHAVVALCGEAFGAIRRLCEMTIEHVKLRKQFQKRLADFQVIQHRIAEMAVVREDAHSALLLAAATGRDEDRRTGTAAMAKIVVGGAARYVAQQSVQLHGAMGVTEELAVGRYFRLLTAFDAVLGSPDDDYDRYDACVLAQDRQRDSAILGAMQGEG